MLEKSALVHAFHLIQKDFKNLIDYVELCDGNEITYSHRIYELLLRTCTEFENNCKGILQENDYRNNGRLNITDYFKISEASKLYDYKVKINIWSPEAKILKPFDQWNTCHYKPLLWYQSYNNVKHDRGANFNQANLKNLVAAISGLLVILGSQFYTQVFTPYQSTSSWMRDDDNFVFSEDSIFAIQFPVWTSDECIPFDWSKLKHEVNPFKKYFFK